MVGCGCSSVMQGARDTAHFFPNLYLYFALKPSWIDMQQRYPEREKKDVKRSKLAMHHFISLFIQICGKHYLFFTRQKKCIFESLDSWTSNRSFSRVVFYDCMWLLLSLKCCCYCWLMVISLWLESNWNGVLQSNNLLKFFLN